MLMPDYLDAAADGLLELYTQLDDSVIRDIVRRILKTGTVTDTAKWQIQKAQESGLLYDEIISEVSKITDATTAQVKALFEDAGIEAVKLDSSIYEAAGLSPAPLLMSPSALRVLNAGYKKTLGQMRNLTLTTASQAQQTFINAVSLAELQVTSGAFDYNTAIKNAIKTASQEGAWVQYPTGHRDRVDVAVRRAVLTGVGQTCAQVSLAYADDMGCDLVETTAHPGARPSHMEWQGKVFSRSGQNPRYPDFEASTGYGTGAGLCGYNCRHSFYPYFEGLSASAYPREKLQEYENKTVDYNDEQISYYDATQIQRKMEREIRETRRQLVGSDEALKKAQDEALKKTFQDDFANQSFKLKKQEAKLNDFLNQTGISGQSDRVQVQGFGHSQSQNAIYAAKIQQFSYDMKIVNPDFMRYTYSSRKDAYKNFCSYMTAVPDGNISLFNLQNELKRAGLIKGNVVPYHPMKSVVLPDLSNKDPNHIMKRMMERHISDDDIQSFVDEALFCEQQFKGTRLVFYSPKGVTVLTKTADYQSELWITKTTWAYADFDENTDAIIEVAKKYGFG